MGYVGPVSVIVFFVLSTFINKFLMSPVVALVFLQEQLEGDFRCVRIYCWLLANLDEVMIHLCPVLTSCDKSRNSYSKIRGHSEI